VRGLWYLTLGCIAFVAITFFEQLPVAGWLGGVVSVAAWIVIARALVGENGFDFETPFGIAWAAVIGGLTCIVLLTLVVSVQRNFLDYDAHHPEP